MASDTPNKKLHGGDVDPSLGTGDRGFEILGEAAVTIETRERAFDAPAAGKDLEANAVGHALDDLDAPAAEFGKCLKQFIAGVGAVGEEVAEPGKEVMDGFDNERRSGAGLFIGKGDTRAPPTDR